MRGLVGLSGLIAVLVTAGAAHAATTIGQTSAVPGAGPPGPCPDPGVEWVQSQVSSGPSYTVPGPGVITSWSTLADEGTPPDTDEGDQVAFRVYRRGPGTTLTPISESGPLTLDVPFLHTTPARVPVKGGELIGLRIISFGVDGASVCRRLGSPLDTATDLEFVQSPDPIPVGQEASYFAGIAIQNRLDLSAVIEADSDGDGFGDETQDSCDIQPTIQSACDLAVTVEKKPKKKTKSRKATIGFAGIGSVILECSLDKREFAPCTSPVSVKKLKPRKHSFRIRALGEGGSTGTEAVVRWRVTGG